MLKKHIAYFDRVWGRTFEKKIVGDMGFSFSDQSDTRTTDIDKAKDESLWYISSQEAEANFETYSEDDGGEFAIYEIYEADMDLGEDLDDGYHLWAGEIVDDSIRLVGIYVCATKEQAGWIEEDTYYKNKGYKFNYRES